MMLQPCVKVALLALALILMLVLLALAVPSSGSQGRATSAPTGALGPVGVAGS